MKNGIVTVSCALLFASAACSAGGGKTVPDADADVQADDTLFPGPDASCDEMARFLLDYAEAHGSCTESSECIPTTFPGGNPCMFCYARLTPDRSYVMPGINSGAGTSEVQDLVQRFSGCCSPFELESGEAWSCACVADAVDISAVPRCEGGRCKTDIWYEGTCHPPPEEAEHEEIAEDAVETTEPMEAAPEAELDAGEDGDCGNDDDLSQPDI